MNKILGGFDDRTMQQDMATKHIDDNGCQQADVRKNDKTTNVGDPVCG